MSRYPEVISLSPDSAEYKLLLKHSDLFKELVDIDAGPLELSADLLFGGDETKWKDFVDIFFPELGGGAYFGFNKNRIYVLSERGGTEGLTDILDYLMVNTPATMMNFAKSQARKQINLPSATVAKGVGIHTPGVGARAYAARRAMGRANENNFPYENNNNFRRFNTEEEENTRPEIRINNNGNNAAAAALNNNENNEGNVVKSNNNTRFGQSRLRKPVLNFTQLLTKTAPKKNKKKKGGAWKTRRGRRTTQRK